MYLHTNHEYLAELARELWATGDTAPGSLPCWICRPKAYQRDELDTRLRDARSPKVRLARELRDQEPHAEDLRLAWSADPDPVVAGAGWAMTTERVAKQCAPTWITEMVRRQAGSAPA